MTVGEMKDLLADHPDDSEVMFLGLQKWVDGLAYSKLSGPEVHYATENEDAYWNIHSSRSKIHTVPVLVFTADE